MFFCSVDCTVHNESLCDGGYFFGPYIDNKETSFPWFLKWFINEETMDSPEAWYKGILTSFVFRVNRETQKKKKKKQEELGLKNGFGPPLLSPIHALILTIIQK